MLETNQRYLETPFSISNTGFQSTQNIFHSDLSSEESVDQKVKKAEETNGKNNEARDELVAA